MLKPFCTLDETAASWGSEIRKEFRVSAGLKLAASGSLFRSVWMGQKVTSVPAQGSLFGVLAWWWPYSSPRRTLRVIFLQAVINHCNTSAVKSVPCVLAL